MTATLRALTKALLEKGDLEPAAWLGDRNEKSAGQLVPLSKLGLSASAELIEYMKLAEEPAFRKEVGGVLGKVCYWGVHQVRSPSSLLFKEEASSVVAFLAGTIPIASDPDSAAFLVAAWGEDASRSAVASFLFNDVAAVDPEPADFVVEALSISDYLRHYGSAKKRPKKTAPICKELSRLYRRGIWIAQIVRGDLDEHEELDEIEVTVGDASPVKLYGKERGLFGEKPHYAAYWLLSHALFGHTELLADALERSRKIKHPAIVDLCKKLGPVAKESASLADVFAKHRPRWTAKELATVRSWQR